MERFIFVSLYFDILIWGEVQNYADTLWNGPKIYFDNMWGHFYKWKESNLYFTM